MKGNLTEDLHVFGVLLHYVTISSVQLMFTRSQSTIFRAVHSMHFITVSLG